MTTRRLPKSFEDNVHRFLGAIIAEMLDHKVTVRFESSKRELFFEEDESDLPAIGQFETGEKRQLVVASNGAYETWLEATVHEYAHFLQWKERMPLWWKDNCWHEWLAGKKKLSRKASWSHLMGSLRLELDCEKRSLELIRKHSLPINEEQYAQAANTIFYGDVLCTEFAKPYIFNRRPTRYPSIVSTVPTTLLETAKEYLNVPDAFRKAVAHAGCWKAKAK
jgi:hypothetical protein